MVGLVGNCVGKSAISEPFDTNSDPPPATSDHADRYGLLAAKVWLITGVIKPPIIAPIPSFIGIIGNSGISGGKVYRTAFFCATVENMIRPDWRECPKDHVIGQWTAMYVTMNPSGEIAMSRFTYERMGEPKAFVLLFDASNNRIGLKPAALTTRNAYPARVHGPRGGKKVRGFRLMSEFQIDIKQTLHFKDAHLDEDGTLILDLRTARISARSEGYRRAKSASPHDRNSPTA